MRIIWNVVMVICIVVLLGSLLVISEGQFIGNKTVPTEYVHFSEETAYGDYVYLNILNAVPVVEVKEMINGVIERAVNYYYLAIDENFEQIYIYVKSAQVDQFNKSIENLSEALYLSGEVIKASDDIKSAKPDFDILRSWDHESGLSVMELFNETRKIANSIADQKVVAIDLNNPKTHTVKGGMGSASWAVLIAVVSVLLAFFAEKQANK